MAARGGGGWPSAQDGAGGGWPSDCPRERSAPGLREDDDLIALGSNLKGAEPENHFEYEMLM